MQKVSAVLSLILVLVLLSACGKSDNFRYKRDVETFNTSSLLYLYGDFENRETESDLENCWAKIEEELEKIENAVSVEIESSDVYRFNNASCGEKVLVSETTAKIFEIAKKIYEKSGGKYDPTVFPLVDLWGFSPRFFENYEMSEPYDRKKSSNGAIELPDSKYVEAFKSLVGFDKIVLTKENGEYYLTKNIKSVVVDGVEYQAKIDFGGIAKGYATDVALEIMKEYGFYEGYFSCGTSSIAFLENGGNSAKDKCFELSIRKPRTTSENGSAYASVAVKNVCVSTSGDYERYYEIDGVRYCHIIDPETCCPIDGEKESYIMSVTLIGESAAELDGLSTAVMTMTLNEAKSFLKKNGIDGVIAYCENGEYLVYSTISNKTEIKDGNYILR